jgi:hypothetical protein
LFFPLIGIATFFASHQVSPGSTLSLGYNCLYLSLDALTRSMRPSPVHLLKVYGSRPARDEGRNTI